VKPTILFLPASLHASLLTPPIFLKKEANIRQQQSHSTQRNARVTQIPPRKGKELSAPVVTVTMKRKKKNPNTLGCV
jgi:hypothetical protein